jgi:hypothetical protein
MVGNPPRDSLVVAIQEAIQDPRRLQELECKVDQLTTENRKTTEQVRKLEAEREALLKQVKDTTLTMQKVSDMVDIPGNVWWKAKMFDAELKNAGHVSGTKMVTFVMGQGNSGWLPRDRGNTTEPCHGLPRGCPGSAAACTTCSGISAGQPTVRTTGTGHCGDGGPRGSDSRARWTRGVSATTTCSIFGNGQNGPPRGAEAE